MHKNFYNIEKQTDQLLQARWPDILKINKKKTCDMAGFSGPVDQGLKVNETGQMPAHCYITLKVVEHEGYGDNNRIWNTRNNSQKSGKDTGWTGDESNYYYHHYFTALRVFHMNINWWPFAWVWVTPSHLKSPGPFSVVLPILIMHSYLQFLQPLYQSFNNCTDHTDEYRY